MLGGVFGPFLDHLLGLLFFLRGSIRLCLIFLPSG
jgi:hypothetical protein